LRACVLARAYSSADLNPIEEAFSKIKHVRRACFIEIGRFYDSRSAQRNPRRLEQLPYRRPHPALPPELPFRPLRLCAGCPRTPSLGSALHTYWPIYQRDIDPLPLYSRSLRLLYLREIAFLLARNNERRGESNVEYSTVDGGDTAYNDDDRRGGTSADAPSDHTDG
jgi:hypothetical protein